MIADKNGRKYLKIADAKEGQIVELDDGFTCHEPGLVALKASKSGLLFDCKGGGHLISGQADDGIHCIGIYPVE